MGEAFPDGRFWLELGPNPPLPQLQGSLAAAVTPTGARVAVGTSAGPVHLLELCGYE